MMKIERKIVQALQEQKPEFAKITGEDLAPIQEHVYHLRTTPAFFVKWITMDDVLGQNELKVNQATLQHQGNLAPRLIHVVQTEGGIIGCWEWLDGSDLRFNHRDLLPKAFAQLGKFHISQRHNQAVYSLLTYQAYDTPSALLEGEHEFLCSFHEVDIAQKTKPVFSKLAIGFPTRVHGDLHPGNIKLDAGKLKFIDWSYSRSSLNLFDLSYIETMRYGDLNENEWWRITPVEAEEVLLAYYGAIGEPVENIDEIQRAISLWTKLWAYYNCVKYVDEVAAKQRKREIIHILEMD